MKDTHSYKGWLNSDFFWKRAVAIYGYAMATGITAYLLAFVAGVVIG